MCLSGTVDLHVLNIVVALLLGFIVWEYTKARIDAKLKEEIPEEGEEMDEAARVAQARHLLVLLRKFISPWSLSRWADRPLLHRS